MFRNKLLLKGIGFLIAVPFFLMEGSEDFSSMEAIYTPKYCLQLEAAYGTGFMSAGGEEGVDRMFDQLALSMRRWI